MPVALGDLRRNRDQALFAWGQALATPHFVEDEAVDKLREFRQIRFHLADGRHSRLVEKGPQCLGAALSHRIAPVPSSDG